MLLALRVPADNARGPLYMEQALGAVHQGNPHALPLSLEFACHEASVGLFCRCPPELRAAVEAQLYSAYPDCSIEPLRDDALDSPQGQVTWSAELRLTPDIFPIRRYVQFEDALNRVTADPLTAILATIRRGGGNRIGARVQITVRPAGHARRHRAEKCLRQLARPFFRAHPALAHTYTSLALSQWRVLRLLGWLLGRAGRPDDSHGSHALHVSGSRAHDREEDLQAAGDKLGRLLFACTIRLAVSGPHAAEGRARQVLREMAGAFGQFSAPHLATFHCGRVRRGTSDAHRHRSRSFLLSTEELATIFHPATATVRASAMGIVESREFEPPVTLPTPACHADLAILGLATFRGHQQRFGILPDDRRRHLALLGKTGMGKSTLLHHLIASDIAAGRGIGLIDPHGDLAEAVLRSVPRHRTNDVVLFDAGDSAYPISFNVLACPRPEDRPLAASGIVSAFKKLYGDSWGPRLEHILRNALLALLEIPGATLLSLLRLLSEEKFRAGIAARLADPVVRTFWQREFAGMPPKLRAEAIAPIQNKVGHFVSSPLLRNILSQGRNALDVRRVMDEGKVLLVNLSKGRTGEDASVLLGSFLVTSVQLAAMGRADVPEEQRRDFYLYVDEFQNFATDSFASVLSEARKYRLGLTIANQYLAQVEEATLHALFGNIGTLITFQVGANDAEVLAEQLGDDLTPQDLLRLPRYQAYARLLIDGMPSRPFSVRTQPPPPAPRDALRPEVVRRYARQRYARPVAKVEQEIRAAFAGA